MGKTMKKQHFLILFLCCFFYLFKADAATNTNLDRLKKETLSIRPSIHGWTSEEKCSYFFDLAIELISQHHKNQLTEKGPVWVDIGTFAGASILSPATVFKFFDMGTVIAIDPWNKLEAIRNFDPIADKQNLEWWSKLDLELIHRSYLRLLNQQQLEKYCITLKMTSEKAASQISLIDVLHIDGNHGEFSTYSDVKLYLPKVRSGGYIILNDTLWEQIQPSVEYLLTACEVVDLIDGGNCLLFKKW